MKEIPDTLWLPPPRPPEKRLTIRGLLLIVAVCAFFSWLISLWAANAYRPGCDRTTACGAKMNMIVLAMISYEFEHGTLPPAYIADKNGKPMHSWRVLLLPYMEQRRLYQQYDFNEPWDGPNNSTLANQIREVYQCQSDAKNPGTMTSYVVVVGPHTAFPGAQATKTKTFTSLADTILLVEVANSGINWMEPRDFDLDQMQFAVNSTTGPSISSDHSWGPHVVFADRHVSLVPADVSPEELRTLFSCDGRETSSTSAR